MFIGISLMDLLRGIKCSRTTFASYFTFDFAFVFQGIKRIRTTFASCFTYYFHVLSSSIPFGGDIQEKPLRDAFSYYFHMLALCIPFGETFKTNLSTIISCETLQKSFLIALSETPGKSFCIMVLGDPYGKAFVYWSQVKHL